MVGDDHDLVVATDLLGQLGEELDHPVEPLERAHRLGPGRSGVVGDLVVVEHVDVDHRGAARHLVGHDRDAQVAQHHRGQPAQEDERPHPGDPRHDVAALLAPPLEQLGEDLAELSSTAERNSPVREVKNAAAPRSPGSRAWLIVIACWAASPENRLATLTPPWASRPRAVGEVLLRHGRVVRAAALEHPAALLVEPAERRDRRGVAVQQHRLPGRGGRRQAGVPRVQPVAARRAAARSGRGPPRPRPPGAAAARPPRRAGRPAGPGRRRRSAWRGGPSGRAPGRGRPPRSWSRRPSSAPTATTATPSAARKTWGSGIGSTLGTSARARAEHDRLGDQARQQEPETTEQHGQLGDEGPQQRADHQHGDHQGGHGLQAVAADLLARAALRA